MKRTERVRLYPTRRQERRLEFILDVTRELYNALLEERREAYRRRGIVVTTIRQYKEVTEIRNGADEFAKRFRAVYRECLDASVHRIDLAFTAFFRRRANGETCCYPRYKGRSRWCAIEFCHGNRALKFDIDQKHVRIPGVGFVRLRRGRRIPEFGRAWIRHKHGRWYAIFECDRQINVLPGGVPAVGIDRGVRALIATSTGTKIRNPRYAAKEARRVVAHKTALMRATVWGPAGKAENKDDRERRKAGLRYARAKEREARARRDYLHKVSRWLVNRHSAIALETLFVGRMTRSARGTVESPGRHVRAKAGLNREMLDASFAMLRSMIVAKAEEAGRQIIEVEPRYTSLTCAVCGVRSRKSRKGAIFECVHCGNIDDADVNAAKIILIRAQSALRSSPYPGAEPGSPAKAEPRRHDEDTEQAKAANKKGARF